ncbi:hypothetical protein C7B77_17050 [Chamaesiphon polymorphus CCALA 037]|uniref:Uncharacterized protein n=1 Tax=Chamaesiphon polymorphus CCALA 037 TaxID=2107692 RepID=A0A2T1GBS8_9CYAN|nr:hypothetical protein C7B77_17050 [Chamaesiphon polymorphus CCALA 037]
MFAAIIESNPASDFLPLRWRFLSSSKLFGKQSLGGVFSATPKNSPCKDKKSPIFAAIDI